MHCRCHSSHGPLGALEAIESFSNQEYMLWSVFVAQFDSIFHLLTYECNMITQIICWLLENFKVEFRVLCGLCSIQRNYNLIAAAFAAIVCSV